MVRAGKEVEVIVAERNGNEYLKTEADREQPNNLLELPSAREVRTGKRRAKPIRREGTPPAIVSAALQPVGESR